MVDDVMAGMVITNGIRCRALFDTGASHTIISHSFASTHGIEIEEFYVPISVQIPGHTLKVKAVCRACSVQIGDWIMPVDAWVMNLMPGLDLVLGMDWLSKYYATVDCEGRLVTFREPGRDEVTYRGCHSKCFAVTVSASRARKLIKNGCTAFLVTVLEGHKEATSLENIPVVCEFPDVFPTELPGLPPDREIEFVIDLVPGTAPISKAPYRMAPAELKELKAQLQDMLDKGFVKPSVSPWGAPVLFVKKN